MTKEQLAEILDISDSEWASIANEYSEVFEVDMAVMQGLTVIDGKICVELEVAGYNKRGQAIIDGLVLSYDEIMEVL